MSRRRRSSAPIEIRRLMGSRRGAQVRVIFASQAWTIDGSRLVSNWVASIDSTTHPTENAGTDLVLPDPAGAPVAGLTITEAAHEVAGARTNHLAEGIHVAGPALIIEDVKESTVDHRVELLFEIAQA